MRKSAVPIGSWQFETPTKAEDQTCIRRLADREGNSVDNSLIN
jgi:hypothetical protein